MKNKKFIYILFLTTTLFSACSTDLDVTGNWKETMVIYGLLDQSQTKQYIKINKAFLGQGNAFEFAQIKDSVQFVHSLNVRIRRNDGIEYPLSPDGSILKDPGIFYAPDQTNAIYSLDNAVCGSTFFNTASSYKLVVKNNESGDSATAYTSLVSDFGAFIQPFSASSVFTFILPHNDTYPFKVEWHSAAGARVYQTIIRFNYFDSLTTGTDTSYLDWVFPMQTTATTAGGEDMTTSFIGENYLQFIASKITSNPVNLVFRKALKTDIILVSATDDLYTFIQVNTPSTGLIQEKPEFTNISNGLGIFSARFNKPPYSKPLSAGIGGTLDSLACGRYTKSLKFLNGMDQLVICP